MRSHILVFAGDALVYRTHIDDAERLIRDGLAKRRCKGKQIRALDLVEKSPLNPNAKPARGNPQKYTYLESLGAPVIGHCHTLKHIPRSAWPIFRSALVDCLPSQKQEQIRQIFKRPTDRVAARAHGQPQQAG